MDKLGAEKHSAYWNKPQRFIQVHIRKTPPEKVGQMEGKG